MAALRNARPHLRLMGERAVLIELGSLAEVHRLWNVLAGEAIPHLEDVVAGARTLLLRFASGPIDFAQLGELLATRAGGQPGGRRLVTIPVTYGGPDLAAVAVECGMTAHELVERHASALYTVGFLGFSPGFAYLMGGPPGLAVRRLETPRTKVPAGSVALAEDMTAVYPQATPGGWRIIGHTPTVMFDPDRSPPALLKPGDNVRFEPSAHLRPAPPVSLRRELIRAPADRPAIDILDTGPLLTVQDGGRRGWAHVGVPVGGAADSAAAGMANALVGNPAEAALLEATAGSCRIRMRADTLVAITGAEAGVTVDGLPARRGVALPLRAGAELVVGRPSRGLRVYVAVAGGLEAPVVLGSRSTDTLSGLGPAPLRAGDRLALGPHHQRRAPHEMSPGSRLGLPAASAGHRSSGRIVLEACWGPRHDWLTELGRRAMTAADWTVSAATDRTGVRLDGPVLPMARLGAIPSEGMVAGAVQLPPGGRPIVLMRNHPPTGGYPVVAVVKEDGVDALAQAVPGTVVSFAITT